MRLCKYAQLLVSIVLVAAALVTRGMGPKGLVWANCISMTLRVCICAAFAKSNLALTISDLNLLPIVKLFGLVAVGGALSGQLVPAVEGLQGSLPWRQVIVSILAAAAALAVAVLVCWRDLRDTLTQIRQRKSE
mmetsp:Transcript_55552/g.132422  ORF Transcript_55552/g.132422 Transcript_55552/m.132422 type:complete len:134 (-) Transcript_55552:156-557(-)